MKTRKTASLLFSTIGISVLLLVVACAEENAPAYRNPKLPVGKRVDDLLGRMTLEEKVAQLSNFWSLEDMKNLTPDGIGGISGVQRENSDSDTAAAYAKTSNALQKRIIEGTRLGIPLIIHDEALHGANKEGATSFPQAIGLAAMWDIELMGKISAVAALETRVIGCRQVLSPVVNIARDPRWGRTQETYGEDPYLTARMGAAFCRAFTAEGIITTPKHFAANFGDGGRDSNPVHFSERLLKEIYFPGFRACIQEGGALSIMPAFNSLDGRPCNANRWLLTKVLRNEWEFEGFTVCDYDAISEVMQFHHTAKNLEEAAVQALSAGLDREVPRTNAYGKPLLDAVRTGMIPESVIDTSVRRVLNAKFRLGLFENPYVDPDEAGKVYHRPEHVALSLQSAREAIVLLKNAGNTLPLGKGIKSIAVIGAMADVAQLGGYSRPGFGSVSILRGISDAVSSNTIIIHERGTDHIDYRLPLIPPEYFSHEESGKVVKRLNVEYFNNMELDGKPVLVRTEPNINLNTGGSPDPVVYKDFISVRWTGMFRSPVTGAVTLSVTSGDGVRFWFDGRKLVESWEDRYCTTDCFTLYLEKGRVYDIKMEIFENKWETKAFLGWDIGLENTENDTIKKAVDTAKKSEAAVVVTSIVEGEFIDRASLDLPGFQERLIRAVAATGTPTVVVLVGGSAITMDSWLAEVDAVIDVWYPGEVGGTAVAEVLFDDYNPAGRLPITFPRSVAQLPLYYNHKPTGRGYDYINMSAVPLFPFGYGLSYTTFEYVNLRLSKTSIGPADSLTVSVDIRNTGKRKGDEVVQLYLRDIIASVTRPVRELKGFERVTLEPGETRTVQFRLTPDELMMLNENMQWVVEPGEFLIMIGASSEDIRLKGSFEVR